jgi:hypothetical protein
MTWCLLPVLARCVSFDVSLMGIQRSEKSALLPARCFSCLCGWKAECLQAAPPKFVRTVQTVSLSQGMHPSQRTLGWILSCPHSAADSAADYVFMLAGHFQRVVRWHKPHGGHMEGRKAHALRLCPFSAIVPCRRPACGPIP